MVLEDTAEWQKVVSYRDYFVVGTTFLACLLSFGYALQVKDPEFLGAFFITFGCLGMIFTHILGKMDVWKNGEKKIHQKTIEFIPIVCLISGLGLLIFK